MLYPFLLVLYSHLSVNSHGNTKQRVVTGLHAAIQQVVKISLSTSAMMARELKYHLMKAQRYLLKESNMMTLLF